MSTRFIVAVVIIGAVVGSALVGGTARSQPTTREDHIAWVAEAFKCMQTIKPGMTRKELLVVFTTEGGLSTPVRRTFVSRDCPYFKVDVEFAALGRPGRESNDRVTMVEGAQDRIINVSKPYLQFSVMD